MAYWSKKKLQERLPKVGDIRREIPTVDESGRKIMPKASRECVVVYVHPEHLWYTVQFKDGIHESYKLPEVAE